MRTKKILSYWLAIASVSFILISSCTTPPSCGDLTINRIIITSRTGNNFNYDIEFINNGPGSVFINGNTSTDLANCPSFQTYLSTNSVLDNLDPPAGGSVLSQGPSPTLLSGQTYTSSFGYHATNPLPIDSYPYLIVVLHTFANTNDCNQNNNTTVIYRTYPCSNCLAQ